VSVSSGDRFVDDLTVPVEIIENPQPPPDDEQRDGDADEGDPD